MTSQIGNKSEAGEIRTRLLFASRNSEKYTTALTARLRERHGFAKDEF